MKTPVQPATRRFGEFEFDARAGELRKGTLRIRIGGQPAEILNLLLEHAGEVVLREEVRAKLWPAETFVEFEHSLNAAVNKLREALGESAGKPRYIETVPRRGYRFIGQLQASSPPAVELIQPAEASPRSRSLRFGVAVALLATGGLSVWMVIHFGTRWYSQRSSTSSRQPQIIHSLAVLPLENLSRDTDQEYFADGMTDALISNLAQISNLRVVSRTSVMQYKNVRRPLADVARALSVDGIIEGAVSWSRDGRVRISVQLLQGAPEQHLWAQSYEGELKDVLRLQDQVAQAIAEAVKVKLTAQEHQRLTSAAPVNPDAYQAYLKGRYFWTQRTEDSVNRAIDYFRQAIEKDPNYAAAYSGLADSFSSLGFSFDIGSLPPNDVHPKARSAALKAVELDDSLAEAHNSLAYTKFNYDWDWPGAEAEFRRSIQLNPGYAHAHHWYAHLLLSQGRTAEALAESNRALDLDELSPIINVHLAWHYYFARQYDKSLEQGQKTLELHPGYGLAYWYRGWDYEEKGMYAEALQEMRKARELLKSNLVVDGDIGHLYAVSGRAREAEQVIANLKVLSRSRYVNPFEIALIYVGLGQNEQAFEWLDRAYQQRSDMLVYLKADPRLDPIRSDPRFARLVLAVGIP